MKNAQKNIKKKPAFVVGKQLPEKLPKKAAEFLSTAVTPERAFEIAAKVTRIVAKNNPEAKYPHRLHNP